MKIALVDFSVSGKKWLEREINFKDVLTITQKNNLPEIIARILVARQVPFNQVDNFLYPTIKNNLPSPLHLKDMEKGASRIVEAILNKEKIISINNISKGISLYIS